MTYGSIDCDTTSSFFRRLIDRRIIHKLSSPLFREQFCDCGGESSFAVIYMLLSVSTIAGFSSCLLTPIVPMLEEKISAANQKLLNGLT